jgi:PucR C-terminal helix-turn-helix domain
MSATFPDGGSGVNDDSTAAAMTDNAVSELVSLAAIQLLAGLDEVSTIIAGGPLGRIVQTHANIEVVREHRLTIGGNLAEIFGAWAEGRPLSEVPVAGENLGLVRTLVRHGVALETAFRSYREGLPVFWKIWMETVAAHTNNQDLLVQALVITHDEVSKYFDRTLNALISEHEAERSRWMGHELARRNEAIHSILAAEVPDAAIVKSVGHRFDCYQTALVFWVDSAVDTDALDKAVLVASHKCDALTFLSLPVGTTSGWVWLATADPVQAASIAALELDPAVWGAAGRSIPGLDGFRLSHAQSIAAQRIALKSPAPDHRIADYDAVEIAALVSASNPLVVTDFVQRELGALAARDHKVLRGTLATYLAAGQSASRAAAGLFIHRNTVLYRVDRARELLPADLDERLLEIMLALRLASTETTHL